MLCAEPWEGERHKREDQKHPPPLSHGNTQQPSTLRHLQREAARPPAWEHSGGHKPTQGPASDSAPCPLPQGPEEEASRAQLGAHPRGAPSLSAAPEACRAISHLDAARQLMTRPARDPPDDPRQPESSTRAQPPGMCKVPLSTLSSTCLWTGSPIRWSRCSGSVLCSVQPLRAVLPPRPPWDGPSFT